jgi:hypothetical protein
MNRATADAADLVAMSIHNSVPVEHSENGATQTKGRSRALPG